jgi:hypothetical protein
LHCLFDVLFLGGCFPRKFLFRIMNEYEKVRQVYEELDIVLQGDETMNQNYLENHSKEFFSILCIQLSNDCLDLVHELIFALFPAP